MFGKTNDLFLLKGGFITKSRLAHKRYVGTAIINKKLQIDVIIKRTWFGDKFIGPFDESKINEFNELLEYIDSKENDASCNYRKHLTNRMFLHMIYISAMIITISIMIYNAMDNRLLLVIADLYAICIEWIAYNKGKNL